MFDIAEIDGVKYICYCSRDVHNIRIKREVPNDECVNLKSIVESILIEANKLKGL